MGGNRRKFRVSLTTGAVLGLLSGLILGVVLRRTAESTYLEVASALEPLGALWIRALRMTVIPLMVSQLFGSMVSIGNPERTLGRLGGTTIGFLLLLVTLGATYASMLAPVLTTAIRVDASTLDSLRSKDPVPPQAEGAANLSEWLSSLIPSNPLQAAVNGEILPLLVFTALFALAAARTRPETRRLLATAAEGVSEAMRILVSWILRLTPVGVFVLGLSLSSRLGSEAIRVLASFVVVLCGMLVGFTLLLYPFVALLGRVSPRRFARAVGPAQIVAFGSRSSMASLPAMMDGARALRLPPETAAFVLPLSVAALKIHRPISSLVNLFFLAHLFGIELSGAMVVTFLLTVVVLRFTSAGLPGEASPLTTLPAYVAMGIPIEGVVLVETVDTVPDMFKTLVNVTGGVALAAVVSRWAPSPFAEREGVSTVEVEPA